MIFKKPKFWDYKKLSFFSYILFPFTLFIRLNNFLLDRFFVSKSNQIKTICVGNIYVGGTGKTPTTIKIYALLKDLNYKVVTAKKLYRTHQDEQKILEKQTRFVTAKSRKKILDHSINNNEEVIIFDDGLQDRSLNYNLKFVCFDADCWIGNGQLIREDGTKIQVWIFTAVNFQTSTFTIFEWHSQGTFACILAIGKGFEILTDGNAPAQETIHIRKLLTL